MRERWNKDSFYNARFWAIFIPKNNPLRSMIIVPVCALLTGRHKEQGQVEERQGADRCHSTRRNTRRQEVAARSRVTVITAD